MIALASFEHSHKLLQDEVTHGSDVPDEKLVVTKLRAPKSPKLCFINHPLQFKSEQHKIHEANLAKRHGLFETNKLRPLERNHPTKCSTNQAKQSETNSSGPIEASHQRLCEINLQGPYETNNHQPSETEQMVQPKPNEIKPQQPYEKKHPEPSNLKDTEPCEKTKQGESKTDRWNLNNVPSLPTLDGMKRLFQTKLPKGQQNKT